MGCEFGDTILVDTVSHKVQSLCSTQLLVHNDTVKIAWSPNRKDTFDFSQIMIIMQSNSGKYFVADTSFRVIVK